MFEEMRALHINETWEVVKLPCGKKLVRCKDVFSIKYKAHGSIERHKAKLLGRDTFKILGIRLLRNIYSDHQNELN